jgi:hypothetical protein
LPRPGQGRRPRSRPPPPPRTKVPRAEVLMGSKTDRGVGQQDAGIQFFKPWPPAALATSRTADVPASPYSLLLHEPLHAFRPSSQKHDDHPPMQDRVVVTVTGHIHRTESRNTIISNCYRNKQ